MLPGRSQGIHRSLRKHYHIWWSVRERKNPQPQIGRRMPGISTAWAVNKWRKGGWVMHKHCVSWRTASTMHRELSNTPAAKLIPRARRRPLKQEGDYSSVCASTEYEVVSKLPVYPYFLYKFRESSLTLARGIYSQQSLRELWWRKGSPKMSNLCKDKLPSTHTRWQEFSNEDR